MKDSKETAEVARAERQKRVLSLFPNLKDALRDRLAVIMEMQEAFTTETRPELVRYAEDKALSQLEFLRFSGALDTLTAEQKASFEELTTPAETVKKQREDARAAKVAAAAAAKTKGKK